MILTFLLGCPSAVVPDDPGTNAAPPTPWDAYPSGLDERPQSDACKVQDPMPALLSETGCFDGTEPIDALVPYEVIAPLYADGATKQRYLRLPQGALIEGSNGDLQLPVGGMAIKLFDRPERRLEVRFVWRNTQGEFRATSYAWREDLSDADRSVHGLTLHLPTLDWEVPSDVDCERCHLDAAGGSLGLELGQLHRDTDYGAGPASQLGTWRALGFVTDLDDPTEIEALPPYDDDDLDRAARAYLHGNCAGCHRPNATGAGAVDFRFGFPTGLCDEPPEFGSPHGDFGYVEETAEDSVLHFRVRTERGSWRMPPLGRTLPDPEGVELLRGWIEEGHACP